jgi:hypothetical protein
VREVYERIREEYEAVRKTIKRAFGLDEDKPFLPEPVLASAGGGFAAREAERKEEAKQRDGPTR